MRSLLKSLSKDKRGNVAMTFALALTPLIVLGGSASDFAYAFMERDRAQDALDRATLAGAKNLGLVSNDTVAKEVAQLFGDFYQPSKGTTASTPNITVDGTTGKVTSKVSVSSKTNFMPLVALDEIASNLTSQVKMGNYDFDVVMVLDTSGSMGGSKISTLKTAAKDLVSTLLNMNTVGTRSDRVQIGVVPFSGSVNVGSSFGPVYSGTTRTSKGTGADWLDVDALSPIHHENWNTGEKANRFDLFAKLAAAYPTYASAMKWAGCVEMRKYPYSVSDTPASASTPDTLYVPMFAPDEAGYKSGSNWVHYEYDGSNNNYLTDNAGTCGALQTYSNTTSKLEGQGRTCKYNSPTSTQLQPIAKDGSDRSLGNYWGPNYYCWSQPILAMTKTKATLDTKINSLSADGNTNILEGVAWGLRTLSAAAPFTEGRTGTDERPLQKVMLVMTDGDNTYGTATGLYNKSTYGPYGYLRQSPNRLELTTVSNTNVLNKQNSLTLEACANAKAAGVTVYSIAFQISNSTTKNMLESCATSSSYYYDAASNSELLAAFQNIANEISRLRISS